MNIVGLIVARISSARLPRKNMLEVWGRPWIEWIIRQAVYSKQVNHNILITDSHEMAVIAKQYDVEVMYQPHDYPGFGTVGGGGAAFDYAKERLGNRIKKIDAFLMGIWSILMKPGDWDAAIDLFREKQAFNVGFIIRAVRNDLMVDVGGNQYFKGGFIKSDRLIKRCVGAVQSSKPVPLWTEDERERACYFYELEPWQEFGNIDYQDDFDVAEFLFYKHILKDGASMTPYKDYYDSIDADESGIKEALKAFTPTRTQKDVMNDKGKDDVLQTRQEVYRDGRTAGQGL